MCSGQQEALPYKRLSFVQSALIMRRAERAECVADGKSLAVQTVDFHAVRLGFAASGTSLMCSGRQSFAVQLVELHAIRFNYAADGTS